MLNGDIDALREINLYAFGEFLDSCVAVEAGSVHSKFKMSKPFVALKDMSLSVKEIYPPEYLQMEKLLRTPKTLPE